MCCLKGLYKKFYDGPLETTNFCLKMATQNEANESHVFKTPLPVTRPDLSIGTANIRYEKLLSLSSGRCANTFRRPPCAPYSREIKFIFYALKWCQSDIESLYQLASVIWNMESGDPEIAKLGHDVFPILHEILHSSFLVYGDLVKSVALGCGFDLSVYECLNTLQPYR